MSACDLTAGVEAVGFCSAPLTPVLRPRSPRLLVTVSQSVDDDYSVSAAMDSDTRESEGFDSCVIAEDEEEYGIGAPADLEHTDSALEVSIDRFGFPTEGPRAETEAATRSRMRKEMQRSRKWQSMLYKSKEGHMHLLSSTDVLQAQIAQWNAVKKHRKLKRRVRKGIPNSLRGTVWQSLCGSRERHLEECSKYGSKNLYRDLVDDERSPHRDQIWKDINRTYRKHVRLGAVGLADRITSKSSTSSGSSRAATGRGQVLKSQSMDVAPASTSTTAPASTSTTPPPRTIRRAVTDGSSEVTPLTTETGIDARVPPPDTTVSKGKSISAMSSLSHLSKSRSLSSQRSTRRKGTAPKLRSPSLDVVKHMVQDTSIPPAELYKHATEAQRQLYNVLKAFSLFRTDIGYCQGMGSITALMLMYMTEEETFWVLATIAEDPKYGMEWLWRPDMPAIGLRFYQLSRMVRILLPKVAKRFKAEGIIDPSMYQASQWFITCFLATEMKFEAVLRVWDIYLNEGMKTVFRMGLGILKMMQSRLMDADMEDMCTMFREFPKKMKTDTYLETCLNLKITHAQLAALEKAYYRAKEKDPTMR